MSVFRDLGFFFFDRLEIRRSVDILCCWGIFWNLNIQNLYLFCPVPSCILEKFIKLFLSRTKWLECFNVGPIEITYFGRSRAVELHGFRIYFVATHENEFCIGFIGCLLLLPSGLHETDISFILVIFELNTLSMSDLFWRYLNWIVCQYLKLVWIEMNAKLSENILMKLSKDCIYCIAFGFYLEYDINFVISIKISQTVYVEHELEYLVQ